jgi:TrmH family RNA methyltransferase
MIPPRPHLRIVLVSPRNPLNLLAASRAAANFGFDDVVVVAPYDPTWEEAKSSPEAGKWLRRARRAESMADAIGDCNWILGTSSLSRRKLSPERVVALDDLPARIRAERRRVRIAILFGSEKRGLTNADLDLCHAVIRIPTSQTTPSMNLGQAVAVCCYALREFRESPRAGRRHLTGKAATGTSAPAAAEILRLVEELDELLPGKGAGKTKEAKRQARLRQMLLRLPLTTDDVTLLLGVFRDLRWQKEKN